MHIGEERARTAFFILLTRPTMNNVLNPSQTSIFFHINFSNIQLRQTLFESIQRQQQKSFT